MEERYINEEIGKEMFEKYAERFKIENREIDQKLKVLPSKTSNLESCVEKAIQLSAQLNTAWNLTDYTHKHKLQYLVFPEGTYYNKKNRWYRTPRVNVIFSAIADIAKV